MARMFLLIHGRSRILTVVEAEPSTPLDSGYPRRPYENCLLKIECNGVGQPPVANSIIRDRSPVPLLHIPCGSCTKLQRS